MNKIYVPDILDDLKLAKDEFNNRFFGIRMRTLDTYTYEEIQQRGMYVSGVPSVDNDQYKDMVKVFIPISKILGYFSEGKQLYLIKGSDITLIYDIIQKYLVSWRMLLERSVNLPEFPKEDLVELESLAEEVFSRARYSFVTKDVSSFLNKHLSEIAPINSENFFANSSPKKADKDLKNINLFSISQEDRKAKVITDRYDDRDDNLPKRDSMKDWFKDKMSPQDYLNRNR